MSIAQALVADKLVDDDLTDSEKSFIDFLIDQAIDSLTKEKARESQG